MKLDRISDPSQHIGDHIRLTRFLRKLTPEAAARQIGTIGRSVLAWELGAREPAISTIPGILRFLGYDPFPPPRTTLPERMFATRRSLGLDRLQAARLFGVGERTWGDWELGHHRPSPRQAGVLVRFLETSYAEAVKGWPGKPPEKSVAIPRSFKIQEGRPVRVNFAGVPIHQFKGHSEFTKHEPGIEIPTLDRKISPLYQGSTSYSARSTVRGSISSHPSDLSVIHSVANSKESPL